MYYDQRYQGDLSLAYGLFIIFHRTYEAFAFNVYHLWAMRSCIVCRI